MKNGKSRLLAGIVAGTILLLLLAVLAGGHEPGDTRTNVTVSHTNPRETNEAMPLRRRSERENHGREANGPPEVGEDPVSISWDGMEPDARRQELERRLNDAFVVLRKDGSDQAARGDAEEALSALRAEMYGSELGLK